MSEVRYFEDFEPGERFQSSERHVTADDVRAFLKATGADHPNHSDAEYCNGHPVFERTCAPGVQTVSIVDGFIAEAITRTSSYSLNYGHDKIRYLRPVYPGDTLQATVEVTAVEEKNEEWGLLTVEALAHNQDDELVLVNINKLLIRRRSAM